MKINDHNIMLFAISLSHQMNTDKEENVQGIYELLLQSEKVRMEVGINLEEMDRIWLLFTTEAIKVFLITKGFVVATNQAGKIYMMVCGALENIKDEKAQSLAGCLVEVYKLHEVKLKHTEAMESEGENI